MEAFENQMHKLNPPLDGPSQSDESDDDCFESKECSTDTAQADKPTPLLMLLKKTFRITDANETDDQNENKMKTSISQTMQHELNLKRPSCISITDFLASKTIRHAMDLQRHSIASDGSGKEGDYKRRYSSPFEAISPTSLGRGTLKHTRSLDAITIVEGDKQQAEETCRKINRKKDSHTSTDSI